MDPRKKPAAAVGMVIFLALAVLFVAWMFARLPDRERTTQMRNIQERSGPTGIVEESGTTQEPRSLTEGTGTPSAPSEEEPESDTRDDAFIVVHLEPADTPTDLSHAADAWPSLVQLVEAADTYSIDLTLLFTPQWGEYALQDAGRLAQVRQWEANGHELGVHHHGASHANPDGFTNDKDALRSSRDYRGTIDDMMAILNQLPASGQMLTGGLTDEDTDWPDGLVYNARTSVPPSESDVLSYPTTATYDGREVIEVMKGGFVTGHSFDLTLEQVEDAAEQQADGQVLGIVFEDTGIEQHYDEILDLFALLQENGVTVRAVADVMAEVR